MPVARKSFIPSHAVSRFAPGAALIVASLLAGCASTQLDAQWKDPQLTSGNPLRGARVLIVCEAQDLVLRNLCQDRLSSDVSSAGATPVAAPDAGAGAPGGLPVYANAARTAGASAVMVATLTQDSTVARSGMSIGVGLGGFGGGGFGGGVGVSAPVGGTRTATGYASNGTIADATGRVMWTARASTAPSNDLNAQVADLTKSLVDGAKKSGLF